MLRQRHASITISEMKNKQVATVLTATYLLNVLVKRKNELRILMTWNWMRPRKNRRVSACYWRVLSTPSLPRKGSLSLMTLW